MRLLLLLCFLGLCFAAPTVEKQSGERILSETIKEKLEHLRKLMLEGNEVLGIPVMDPLKMDEIGFKYESNYLSFELDSSKIVLTGLSDFDVYNVDISLDPLGLKYDFTLPLSLLTTEAYDFDGLVFQALPIYGKGKSHFEVKTLQIEGFSNLGVGLKGVYIKDMNLKIYVGELKSETTGMIGGGDIDNVINAILGDLAPDFFNANSELLSKKISEISIDIINMMLDGISLSDLINIIKPQKL